MTMQSRIRFAPAKERWPGKGEYRKGGVEGDPSAVSVLIGCPSCGEVGNLNHEITPEGLVNPSIVCPNSKCSFHDWGILVDW